MSWRTLCAILTKRRSVDHQGLRADRAGARTIGFLRRAAAESLESRLLLSAYTLGKVVSFDISQTGNDAQGISIDASGNLFGVTDNGGAYGFGTVYEIPAGTNTLTPLANAAGFFPAGQGPAIDANGDLFGTTYSSQNQNGSVYEVAKGSSGITTLATFSGSIVDPDLTADAAGDLFGSYSLQAQPLDHVVYEIPHGTTTVNTIGTLDTTSGLSLAVDSAGNVYGSAFQGGENYADGGLFEIANSSPGTVTTLASFNSSNGANPVQIIVDSAGNLFGVTQAGGANNAGNVFELPAGATTITDLADFSLIYPQSSETATLKLDSSGDLFGALSTTSTYDDGRPGTLDFEVVHGSGAITTLATVSGLVTQFSGSAFDSAGDLYGTESTQVPTSTLVQIPYGAHAASTFFTFSPPALGTPPSDLVRDSAGDLFGYTGSPGVIFEIPAGSVAAQPYANLDLASGFNTEGPLLIDSAGNLYGIVSNGTAAEAYEVAAGSSAATTLATLPGNAAFTKLVVDPAGDLYGEAYEQSTTTSVIFEIPHGATTVTTLDSLSGQDASLLTTDSGGNVYGVYEPNDGSAESTVFEIAQGANTVTTLASLSGINLTGGLGADANDDLFGATETDLVELPHGASTATTLAPLPAGAEFSTPQLDAQGDLYWTTNLDTGRLTGELYELAAGASAVTTLYTFNDDVYTGADAVSPGPIVDPGGDVFVATKDGGGGALGSVDELTPLFAPSITTQPASQTVNAGQTVTLTAAAGGTPTPTVQWQVSTDGGATFSDVGGATSATYTFTASSDQNGNEYRAVFTNSQGSLATSAATLTVNAVATPVAPTVTTDPISQSDFAGNTVIFTAAANGYPTPTVQWQVSTNSGSSFSDIAGATSATYSFTALARQNGYEYRAMFINSQGSAQTTAATLTIVSSVSSTAAPVVTTQPISQSVSAGASVVFSAAASGNPTPTVQWQLSTNGGSTFGDIPGATSTTYSFTAASGQDGYAYRAVFTNGQGSATTNAAILNVSTTPANSPLTPALNKVSLPASVVAGTKLNAALSTSVTNNGSAFKGKVTFNFYINTAATLDGNQLLLKSVPESMNLKAGKSKPYAFKVSALLPASLAAGTYHLLVEIVDRSSLTNLVATTQTIQVVAPFVQPVVSIGAVTPATIIANRFATVVVTVTNAGNVAGAGITLSLSPSEDGITPIDGTVLYSKTSRALRIAANHKQVFRLRFKVSGDLAAGAYLPLVTVTLGGVTTTVAGTAQFTVA